MLRAGVSGIVIALFVCAGHAQTFRGAISGTVTDPSGAVIQNAQVKATETATGLEHNTLTTSDGEFSFQDIPLGSYKVTVTAPGFPAYTVEKVEVAAGSIFSLPIKLSMQQQSTTVEVSAAALSLDTTSATQSTTISTQLVQDLPLNGRDFTQMIALAPGYSGYSVGGYGSLNGTRPNQMNWQIDGVDNNDFWHNIPAVNQGGVSGIAGVVMPIDAVDEFSAQTQSGAEAGRNAGGTVNLVLKAGGNQIHGSAYYYWRNEIFSDPSPFYCSGLNPACPSTNPTKAPELRNEVHHRTFRRGHGAVTSVCEQCTGYSNRTRCCAEHDFGKHARSTVRGVPKPGHGTGALANFRAVLDSGLAGNDEQFFQFLTVHRLQLQWGAQPRL
jgi:hypothetical protein